MSETNAVLFKDLPSLLERKNAEIKRLRSAIDYAMRTSKTYWAGGQQLRTLDSDAHDRLLMAMAGRDRPHD